MTAYQHELQQLLQDKRQLEGEVSMFQSQPVVGDACSAQTDAAECPALPPEQL
jgi:hypothetical protein